ncbi:hypothetical protein [Fibrobacter sp. UWS1]|uniref:hypothetical protein n=1 Tax=Fibrobacter sp. UWS1 TaxID=1896220 RepID=UPI000BB0E1FC|nr:hypothetical protein [Fibrobacter sp. UWS1]PBC67315.1 hypothetical protein BGX14_2963 [Fibrobacter sp. UWS1]
MSFFGRIGKVEKFRPGSPGASPRELFFFPIQPISVALTVKIRDIQDTINTNKCGMSLRAGGFAYLTESRNESNDVSFWTNESDGSDYFYTLYVCYNYMSVSSLGHSIETMKYYIRCIKE